jgi:hypothetical protein
MQWSLVKTGATLFDLLHAYGLGILLAHASGHPIVLRDTGPTSTLISDITQSPSGPLTLLNDVLSLPTPQEIVAATLTDASLPLANLDGLLTILFTTSGGRVLSVSDLKRLARHDESIIQRVLDKVQHALARWKTISSKEPFCGAQSWLARVLQDYHADTPTLPIPANAHNARDLSVVMMLDPSFSYSTRRPRSDGLVSHNTQITLDGTRFAPVLAAIGAARFLRAHRVSAGLINCLVPKATSIMLTHSTAFPLLPHTDLEASQALLVQWLASARHMHHDIHAQWTGLSYQTIQTQGMKASIPRTHGSLDLTWLTALSSRHREPLLSFWHQQLALPPEQHTYPIEALLLALSSRSLTHWADHLLDLARSLHAKPDTIRSYHVEEIKEVLTYMHTSHPCLLKQALEQKTGTLRFGHALRLLGDFNAAALRDLVDDLDTVTTLDQLLHALALTAQHCQIATAKTTFMIVPTDDDLAALLMDVEHSSPHTIARFLIVLSALRYPRLSEEQLAIGQLTRLVSLLLATRHTQSAQASLASTDTIPEPVPTPVDPTVTSLQPE